MTKIANCSVYVATCDRYQDLWPGFFHCWNKCWPDCPFEVYLGANESICSSPNVTTLRSSPSTSWSERVAGHLAALPHDYIIFFLEDFYLRGKVHTKTILELLAYLELNDGAMLRLIPKPPPQTVTMRDLCVGECLDGTPYRVCTQVAIWRREILVGLLRKGENIWEFEHGAQERAKAIKRRFFAVTRAAMPYRGLVFHHVVEKGRWIPSEYWRCRWRGIPCNKTSRELLSPRDFLVLFIAEAFARLFAALFGGRAYLVHNGIRNLVPHALMRRWQCLRRYPEVKSGKSAKVS